MKLQFKIFAVVCYFSISSVCMTQTFYVKENQTLSSSIIHGDSFEMFNIGLTERGSLINYGLFGVSDEHEVENKLIQKSKHCFTANQKVGLYNLVGGDIFGITIGNSLNYKYNKFLMSADFHYYQKFTMFGTPDEYSMISLYAGTRLGENSIIFDAQVGLGLIWSNVEIDGGSREERDVIMITILKNSYNFKTGIKFVLRDDFAIGDFAIGVDMHYSKNGLNEIYAFPLLSLEFGNIR